jgi:cobalt/nickel transport system ATP-binding protein
LYHTLEVESLSFSYPDGFQALRGVTLAIGPDEKVALVGPNGAGKSTLMLHLNGLLRATEGQVCVGGLPVIEENLGQIRAWVGLVFQNPDDQLFSPKVFDDVAFGPLHMGFDEAEVRRRSHEALEAVGMAGYADHISHHLSLGQKKRVSIATVLSMDPKILVLDEPSAGLDPRARRSLINLLAGMERTMLVATHDMRLVEELFPRTIVLDEGLVVADGPTRQLLGDEALLNAHGLEKP